MCCNNEKNSCCNPEILKEKPGECCAEQIEECHGTDKEHPCCENNKE